MKLIKTEDAVGSVLAHDLTQIIIGQYKGARFRKGHIVKEEDIPILLSMGKENLYVWEKQEGWLHENEAAEILRDLAMGEHMIPSDPQEGKIELTADCDGLLKINTKALLAINSTPQMMIATRHGNTPVKKGDKLAGTRIIPLVIEEEKMNNLQKNTLSITNGKPVLELIPYSFKKVGIVTTGSEVYKGRIEDT
ncbi:MAG: molybdopterin-binding protein, partial [Candidatus Riflebacteria bacterium]|nr:molybdopterin-binding protein [Candidatus Riflebacteria bacterium]